MNVPLTENKAQPYFHFLHKCLAYPDFQKKNQVFSFPDNHFIDEYARFLFLDTKDKNAAVANSMNYMTKKGEGVVAIDLRNAIPPTCCWSLAYINMNNGGFLYGAFNEICSSWLVLSILH